MPRAGKGSADTGPTRHQRRPTPGVAQPSGERVTCSRCSWATSCRGRWRKQSRAFVKATVTTAPPDPAPAKRSLLHIVPVRPPEPTREQSPPPSRAGSGRPGRRSPRTSTGPAPSAYIRLQPPSHRSSEPPGGGTVRIEFSLSRRDCRWGRWSSQSKHAWPILLSYWTQRRASGGC